jgi:hypothetical protein
MSIQGMNYNRLEPLRWMVFSRPAGSHFTGWLDIFPQADTIISGQTP